MGRFQLLSSADKRQALKSGSRFGAPGLASNLRKQQQLLRTGNPSWRETPSTDPNPVRMEEVVMSISAMEVREACCCF